MYQSSRAASPPSPGLQNTRNTQFGSTPYMPATLWPIPTRPSAVSTSVDGDGDGDAALVGPGEAWRDEAFSEGSVGRDGCGGGAARRGVRKQRHQEQGRSQRCDRDA